MPTPLRVESPTVRWGNITRRRVPQPGFNPVGVTVGQVTREAQSGSTRGLAPPNTMADGMNDVDEIASTLMARGTWGLPQSLRVCRMRSDCLVSDI